MLTPRDIHQAEFKRVLRGYSPEEVDKFLRRVVSEYEKVYQENEKLKKELQQLQEQLDEYSKTERQLSLTVEVARQAAGDLKEAAHKEAEAVLKKARAEAEELRQKAVLSMVEHERALKDYVDDLRRYRHRLLEDLDLLTRHLHTFEEPKLSIENNGAGSFTTLSDLDESDHEDPADSSA